MLHVNFDKILDNCELSEYLFYKRYEIFFFDGSSQLLTANTKLNSLI